MAKARKIEYLYVSYLRNSKQVCETDLDTFRARFIRFMIRFLAIVARIDVCGKCKILETRQRQEASDEFLGIKCFEQSQWWKRHGRRWLSDLILILYLLFSAHLLTNLIYQYGYDFNKLRVARLRALVREEMVSSRDFARLSLTFLDRADEFREVLHLIGAPHKHISIAIECLYLYFVIFGIIMYYVGFLYYRLVTPYDFHFVRELLDYHDEWLHSNRLVQLQVESFSRSYRTFLDIELKKPGWLQIVDLSGLEKVFKTRRAAESSSRGWFEGVRERGRWQELTRNHYRMHEVLMQMLTCGALRPYNKLAHWVERRIEMTYFALSGIIVFAALFSTTMMSVAFYQRDKTRLLSTSELAILSSTVGLVTIITLSSALTTSTFFIGAIDQLAMVGKMRDLILACWSENTAHFASLVESKSNQPTLDRLASMDEHMETVCDDFRGPDEVEQQRIESSCVDAMNSNLLFVFLQYKIFIDQYKPSRKTFQSVILFATALIMLIPVIVKLHIAYLNLSNYNNAKWFALAVSPAILVMANFVLLPVCHLDAQFVKLLRIWSSLIAHIHETESHPAGRGLYDRHSVTLLLREIRLTFQSEDQSEVSSSAITSSYTTLVKVHFWYGAAILAIVSEDLPAGHISPETSSSFFTDPFGIFARSNFLGV